MPRPERFVWAVLLLAGLLAMTGCSRLTFIKPNLKKMEVEQVRQPVRVRDSAEVRARLSAQQQVDAATSAYSTGDFVSAEKNARAALKADPQSVDAHTVLGLVAESRGRSTEAGDWFRKAAQLSAGRAAEASNYGAWLCRNGQPVEALRYFDHAVNTQAAEARADSLANAGACALSAGLNARADSYLRQAIHFVPNHALALESLARFSLAQGDALEARSFIERRLSAAPASASALQTALEIEDRLGDSRSADRYRQRLRSEFPNTRNPSPGK